jgi:hypothetical protein
MNVNTVFCQNNLLPAGAGLGGFRGGVAPVGLGGPDTKVAKGIIIDF